MPPASATPSLSTNYCTYLWSCVTGSTRRRAHKKPPRQRGGFLLRGKSLSHPAKSQSPTPPPPTAPQSRPPTPRSRHWPPAPGSSRHHVCQVAVRWVACACVSIAQASSATIGGAKIAQFLGMVHLPAESGLHFLVLRPAMNRRVTKQRRINPAKSPVYGA
jgi:hypothetical protein